ncbi:MAG TPA: hypothetical protein VHP63_03995, partial [candidate division Zixibacteria bacterium]|nr:hypothetical protein [candidate division Zixibacteria bacterium]
FLSSEILQKRLESVVSPYKEDRIKYGAYELSMGSEVYLSNQPTKQHLKSGEQFVIPPGQFALLLTEEKLDVPKDCLAFISIKFSKKKRGLLNVSGFHVDPGFKGRLKFSVYNAGPNDIEITQGTSLFLIWLASLGNETKDSYKGEHQNQETITDEDVASIKGEIASPAFLNKRLDQLSDRLSTEVEKLKSRINVIQTIGVTVLVAIVVVFLGPCKAPSDKASYKSPEISIESNRTSEKDSVGKYEVKSISLEEASSVGSITVNDSTKLISDTAN